MPLTSFFTVLISSSLASTAAPTAAILDFGVVGGDARLGTVYAERFATRLDQRGVKTSTQQAMSSMLSLERQKQLLGCADDSASCMAELAGALGSTYLTVGQVAFRPHLSTQVVVVATGPHGPPSSGTCRTPPVGPGLGGCPRRD